MSHTGQRNHILSQLLFLCPLSGSEGVTDVWKSTVKLAFFWLATKCALMSVLADGYSVCAVGQFQLLPLACLSFPLNCLLHSYCNNYKGCVNLH